MGPAAALAASQTSPHVGRVGLFDRCCFLGVGRAGLAGPVGRFCSLCAAWSGWSGRYDCSLLFVFLPGWLGWGCSVGLVGLVGRCCSWLAGLAWFVCLVWSVRFWRQPFCPNWEFEFSCLLTGWSDWSCWSLLFDRI